MTRNTYSRFLCNSCNEYPSGFQSLHNLHRHHDRAHADHGKAWICVDPLAADPSRKMSEDWRPKRGLYACAKCREQRTYNKDYNAARHLRRVHFCPRKRGCEGHGQTRLKEADDGPSMEWIKLNGWLDEIEVGNSMRKEVSITGAESEDEKISDPDDGKKCFQPALVVPRDLYQQHFSLQMPFMDRWNLLTILDNSRELGMHVIEPATAITTRQGAVNLLNSQHSPPSQQVPLQTPHAMSSRSGGLSSTGDGNDAHDQESEVSTPTVADEELLLNVASVSRLARVNGRWFADVDFEESLLPHKFFGQLLLSNNRLSGLAKTAQFTQGYCRLQWLSETVPFFEARLPSYYAELVQQLDILCSAQDGVEWHAHDSAYSFEGSYARHHLCLGGRCQSCAHLNSIVASAYPNINWAEDTQVD